MLMWGPAPSTKGGPHTPVGDPCSSPSPVEDRPAQTTAVGVPVRAAVGLPRALFFPARHGVIGRKEGVGWWVEQAFVPHLGYIPPHVVAELFGEPLNLAHSCSGANRSAMMIVLFLAWLTGLDFDVVSVHGPTLIVKHTFCLGSVGPHRCGGGFGELFGAVLDRTPAGGRSQAKNKNIANKDNFLRKRVTSALHP